MNSVNQPRPLTYLYKGEYIIPRSAIQSMRAVWLRELKLRLDKPNEGVVE